MEAKIEMKFCRLCGKHKPVTDFVNIPLARLERGIVVQVGCEACKTVIHNVRMIIHEEEMKERKLLAQEAEKKLIVVPGLKLPSGLKAS